MLSHAIEDLFFCCYLALKYGKFCPQLIFLFLAAYIFQTPYAVISLYEAFLFP